MDRVIVRRVRTLALVVGVAALAFTGACTRKPAPKRYTLHGQILAVHPDTQQLTIKHGDVEGLMPGMTMSFPTKPALMKDRKPGEMIDAVLQIDEGLGTVVEITSRGVEPLPDPNQTSMAAPIGPGDEIPDVALVDQNDHRRSLVEWADSYTVITFIYTSCPLPNFCPLMDQNFSTIQRMTAEDATLKGKVKLISISFDPAHDTPAVLLAHARELKADPRVWTFLTGDQVTVDRLAGKFGVGVIREGGIQNGGITHNLRTFLVGPDRKVIKIYPDSDWTPGTVLADLRTAVARR
jgi:protein SCO1/2